MTNSPTTTTKLVNLYSSVIVDWHIFMTQKYILISIKINNKYTESELQVEMQKYIDISPYHDTLGSDTVSIHI